MSPLTSQSSQSRATSSVQPPPAGSATFLIGQDHKSYKHQYANIYFVRLRHLKDHVEIRARERWQGVSGNPVLVPSVLEVQKSQLCYIIGTVYMDMPLKPNVMEDIARDQSIPAPPPLAKICSPQDHVMLEDESGRIQLVGERVKAARLVTGVIVGALGAETPNGEFEVVDLCYAEMPPQASSSTLPDQPRADEMEVDDSTSSKDTVSQDRWVAAVSGLDVGSPSAADALIQMLLEYLTGEGGEQDDQVPVSQITRLIIAGNSLAEITLNQQDEIVNRGEERKPRRYGYDAATFSAHPMTTLGSHLLEIGSVMPIHILPGETDPSGVILPQQPLPRGMFGPVATLSSFVCETNPTYLRLGYEIDDGSSNTPDHQKIDRTILINSGQPLNDMFKYLPSPPNTRLSILESTLRWRHMAPTAPDTLWCHPYFASDPFLMTETPHIYLVGGQKKFATRLVQDAEAGMKQCRIVMIPHFARTGILVLINLRSLEVRTIKFWVEGMGGGGEELAVREKADVELLPKESQ